jgi:UDPglucose 6-dehydrogenase
MTAKIAIIGLGFVGNAIHKSLDGWMSDDKISLIDPAKGLNTPYTDIADYDAAFVCVPSPQSADGTADTSILEKVLSSLKQVNFNGVIISKVTAPPGVYQRLQEIYPNLVHAPEFLTAANAEIDYRSGKFAIIGGSVAAYRNEAERIIKITQTSLSNVLHCSIQEAALAKYSINSFLATKVIFMNELALLANELDCDWEVIRNAVTLDKRIGKSHMQVPGPDGEYGFGGMCFPKDTSALIKCAEQVDTKLSVLDTAVKTNLILRLTDPK